MLVYCRCCYKNYNEKGHIGCDAIYICSDCQTDRSEEVRKIYMNNHHYWHGCDIGWSKGECPSCRYNDICKIIDKQIHNGQGVAGQL